MAALDALNAKPQPKTFAYRAQALAFRGARSAVQYSMVFQVPMQNMSYREDKQTAKLRTHISLLAVVKDPDGQVAAKVSRDLANDIPADKFEAFARGDLTFAQPLLLSPGRYTVETAVVDRENGAASVKRAALVVSDQAGIGLSELVPVRRVDPFDIPRDGGWNPPTRCILPVARLRRRSTECLRPEPRSRFTWWSIRPPPAARRGFRSKSCRMGSRFRAPRPSCRLPTRPAPSPS